MSSEENAIIARGLSKRFPRKVFPRPEYFDVLRDVSFSIKKGERVALIGSNGSGKTTLLKTMATIYLPDAGELLINGYDVYKHAEQIASHTTLISPALDFQKKLTLRQTLKFFHSIQAPYGELDIALDFLKRMHMEYLLDKRLESFSEGQKAITRIAIGMMKKPDIFFLDEITTGLDVNRKEDLVDFLKENVSSDQTIVMVDHDPLIVERICDSYILLSRGVVVKQGLAKDIGRELAYKYEVMAIMKDRPEFDEIVMLFPDQADDVLIDGHVVYFRAEDEDELYSIIERLRLNRETITKYVVSLVDLSNIYHALKPETINEIRTVEDERGLPERTPTFEELQEIIRLFGIMIDTKSGVKIPPRKSA